MKTFKNSAGFTAIEAIIIVVIVAVVGLSGWFVYHRSRTPSHATKVDATAQVAGKKALSGVSSADKGKPTSLQVTDGTDTVGVSQPVGAKDGNKSVDLYLIDSRGYSYQDVHILTQIFTQQGKRYEPSQLVLDTKNVDLSTCSISHKYVPDDPPSTPQMTTLTAMKLQKLDLYDGDHAFTVTCTDGTSQLTASFPIRIADRFPEECANFVFGSSAISATSLSDLASGMVGNWEGCVTTPWMATYYVKMSFNADGSYTATSDEVLDGMKANALYWGTEDNSPLKKYAVTDFSADNQGTGTLVIFFGDSNTTVDGSLKKVTLMGDRLSFDLYNRGYGPVSFQLIRH